MDVTINCIINLGQLDWITGYPDIWLNMISRYVYESVSE